MHAFIHMLINGFITAESYLLRNIYVKTSTVA